LKRDPGGPGPASGRRRRVSSLVRHALHSSQMRGPVPPNAPGQAGHRGLRVRTHARQHTVGSRRPLRNQTDFSGSSSLTLPLWITFRSSAELVQFQFRTVPKTSGLRVYSLHGQLRYRTRGPRASVVGIQTRGPDPGKRSARAPYRRGTGPRQCRATAAGHPRSTPGRSGSGTAMRPGPRAANADGARELPGCSGRRRASTPQPLRASPRPGDGSEAGIAGASSRRWSRSELGWGCIALRLHRWNG
jgi:hypothetical protein